MSDGRRRRCARLAVVAPLLSAAACRTGPNFVRPAAPPAPAYGDTVSAVATRIDSSGQHVKLGTVQTRWWEAFRSPELNDIVEHVIASNQTLSSSQATLAQAREVLAQANGGRYPSIDASANAEREGAGSGVSGTGAGRTTNVFSVGAVVSYPLDLFGGVRRFVEQQGALEDEARYQLAAAYLAVTGSSVSDAIAIASLRAQLQAVEDILANDQQTVELVQIKLEAGKAARVDVLSAQTQLESDRALAPPLREQLATTRHALAILVGHLPSEWSPPDLALDRLTMPAELPVSMPSDLVHQRPDILAAEARLHASGAAIGVASAQLYPSVTLSGSLASQSSTVGRLLQGPSAIWNLLASAAQPIFHGGALRAQKRAAVDAYDASFAVYRQTVLSAFQQVADLLDALDFDRQLADAQSRALAAASQLMELQRASYVAGKSNLLQLLDAQRSYEQARLAHARTMGTVYQDVADLSVAMGGGWWNTPPDQMRTWGTGTGAP